MLTLGQMCLIRSQKATIEPNPLACILASSRGTNGMPSTQASITSISDWTNVLGIAKHPLTVCKASVEDKTECFDATIRSSTTSLFWHHCHYQPARSNKNSYQVPCPLFWHHCHYQPARSNKHSYQVPYPLCFGIIAILVSLQLSAS